MRNRLLACDGGTVLISPPYPMGTGFLELSLIDTAKDVHSGQQPA